MSDYMIRGMSADGLIRAFAAVTTDTVEEMRRRHNTTPVVTAALGRLLTAAGMMGLQMKGQGDRLTLKVRGDGPVETLVAVADSAGHVKGFPGNPAVDIPPKYKGKLDVGGAVGKGELTVVKDLGLKEPYVGTVELQTGEIAEDITYYYAVSQQTPSSVALGVLVNPEGTVRQAGGFMLQLLPGVPDESIDKIEKRLTELPSVTQMLEDGLTPEDILAQLIGEFGIEFEGDRQEVSFFCDCSKEKVRSAVANVGKYELLDMMCSQETITAHCDYCNTDYVFNRTELKELYKEYFRKGK